MTETKIITIIRRRRRRRRKGKRRTTTTMRMNTMSNQNFLRMLTILGFIIVEWYVIESVLDF